ncbi:thermonuclease family protein [Alteraurantiacibacter buctensis]|uniref:TNase-like domain-containing protein n=1 Tax=Alteraurantiacibacter buctensis TaxID=1503981 RepID=A0A844Z0X8_9SPHN|nr:thermonuclease family protein [Alteraurantiacibacter buctensis]MXO72364.1 hypothetical protein [Alteraurantiacibacter buctensis]
MPGQDWSAFEEVGPADPWAGFEEVTPRERRTPSPTPTPRPSMPSMQGRQVTGPVDGDTVRLDRGPNFRLWGIDAPELAQQGWDRQGVAVPVGQQSRDALGNYLDQGTITFGRVQDRSWARPVGPLAVDGVDLGQSMAASGNAFVAPQYLASDPARRYDYMQAERLARLNGLGLHDLTVQAPQDFRRDVPFVAPRQNAAQAWDTPTPFAGMTAQAEQDYARLLETGSKQEIMDFVEAQGFRLDPADVDSWIRGREQFAAAGQPLRGSVVYAEEAPQPLTNLGDGAEGAGIRGTASGLLASGLDEAGALVDALGATPNRENVWNSDRRFADIFVNNQRQNAAILGYDEAYHPYASYGGQVAGSLVGGVLMPYAGGLRTTGQLARVGAGFGAATGFLDTDGSLADRATGAAIGAAAGAILDPALVRGAEAAAPILSRGVAAGRERLSGLGQRLRGPANDVAPEAAAMPRVVAPDGLGGNSRNIADLPPSERAALDAEAAKAQEPLVYDEALGDWRNETPAERLARHAEIDRARDASIRLDSPLDGSSAASADPWAGFEEVAPAPSAAMAMDGEAMPSVSQAMPQPVGAARPAGLTDPLTQAQREAAAANLSPGDVLPIASNEIGSAAEAAARDAGRFEPVRVPNERGELTRRTFRTYNGGEVKTVGPVDLVGWLRLNGGLVDQGGELAKMGIRNNRARTGMDFVGQESRFGPMVNDNGMLLDDAALRAWEEGYFPELTDRPTLNQFLDALNDTYNGRTGRRFLADDLPEIENYYNRQYDRRAIARQESETGAPVYRDISEPADEPQPFAPPEAYEEWPAGGPDLAGNIRLDRLESPQDIKRALAQTEARFGFDAATRGRVTQAETERLAGELNMTADQLLSRRRGQALNAEEALAARQILAKSGNDLVNAARRIAGRTDPDGELMADFRRKLMRHAAIQEQVSGATAEAGRALQQFRMMASSRVVRDDVLTAIVEGGGGKRRLTDAAQAVLDAAEVGPGVFNAVVDKTTDPRFRDKLAELYINMLLSGPQTHAVNIVSNTLTAMAQIPEFAGAALIGRARQAVTRQALDRVLGSEVGARAFGLLQGAREGARMFAQGLRTGEPADFVSKVEGQQFRAISGLKGEVIRVPTRLLTAEDEFFKGVARRMELNAQAVRVARGEGLAGDALRARIAELSANPTDEMLARALDYGRYLTFQRQLGDFGSSVSRITTNNLVAKVFVPFVRTPINLLKFAIERSPAAPVLREWRKEFAAGGASRDLAIARATIGTGMGMLVYEAALQGHITGSPPTDQAKARLLYADGWKPYSIRIGDTYYSYRRLDPFSTTLGMGADMALMPEGMSETQRENEAVILTASIMGNLASKTWLSGISDLLEALSDPQRNAERLLERLAGSFTVPTGVNQVARVMDPTQRETDGVRDAVQNRIPGLSDNLLPRRNIWGAPITDQGGVGPDIVSPIWQSEAARDPVNLELMRLDYAPGYPQRKVGGVELTPEEYDRYLALSGQAAHDELARLVRSQEWRAMPDDDRIDAAQRIVREARADARAQLFGGSPAADEWADFEMVE